MNIVKGLLFLEFKQTESAYVRGEPHRRFGTKVEADRQFGLRYAASRTERATTVDSTPERVELRRCA